MFRWHWILVLVAMVFGLLLWSGLRRSEAKQPPPGPQIVAFAKRYNVIDGFVAVASDGTIYTFDQPSNVCGTGLFSMTAIGNLFNGPQPSPVVAADDGPGGIRVVLENGDFWRWCWQSNSGVKEGNIFVSAGG